jgi:hypothetical protein
LACWPVVEYDAILGITGTERIMTLKKDTVRVRVSKDLSLGETMNTIREWMDGENIEPTNFRSSVEAHDYALIISFRTPAEAEHFRECFVKLTTT